MIMIIIISHQLNQAFLCLYLWLLSPTEFQKIPHFKVTLKTITKNQGMTNSMFFWLTLYIFSMLIPLEPDLDSTFDFCVFTTLTDDNKSLNQEPIGLFWGAIRFETKFSLLWQISFFVTPLIFGDESKIADSVDFELP